MSKTDIVMPAIKDSKNFVADATDTFKEIFFLLLGLSVVGGVAHWAFEGGSIWNSIAWAVTTAFTVGYSSTNPVTLGGQVVGAILMTLSIFVIVPMITALMTRRRFAKEIDYLVKVAERLESKINAEENQVAAKKATRKK